MIGWDRIQGGNANLKRWVLSFERNVPPDNEKRVSGGREFQSLGAMTEKALLFTQRCSDIWDGQNRSIRLYDSYATDYY